MSNRLAPYFRARDSSFKDFLCRILGMRKYFMTRIVARHMADGQRHYHVFDHAIDVAGEILLASFSGFTVEHPHELLVAALYHDAAYVPGDKDNEEKSAEFARREMAEFDLSVDRDYVGRLIWLTSKHFTDADIHGLAAPYEYFVKHQEDVMAEFLPTSNHQDVADNQVKFLSALVQKPHIFYSKRARRLCDPIARENIKRWLDEWKK